jgi:hypothetical protein
VLGKRERESSERPMATRGIAESPFGAKGLLFQGTRTFFEAEGLWDALLDALSPPLRAFMEQRFFAGTYYEALLIPELIRVEARVCGQTVPQYLQRRTEWQAKRDLHSVYRVVVRVAPTEMTISRLVMLMTQMFNFGEPTIEKPAAGHLEVAIGGVPEVLTSWLRQCLALYGEICLRMAGSKTCEIRRLASRPDAEILGHRTVALCFSCHWT